MMGPMQPSDARVYLGALSPEALELNVSSSISVPDLDLVTSADVLPLWNGQQLAPWTVDTYTNRTTTTLRLTHLWLAGDTSMSRLGLHILVVRLHVGGTMRRCKPARLFVLPLED